MVTKKNRSKKKKKKNHSAMRILHAILVVFLGVFSELPKDL